MRHMFTSTSQYLAAVLVIAIGLDAYGCKDTASTSNETQVPLADLSIAPPGALQPAFSSNTTSYTATVTTPVTSVTVTATPKDSTTTLTINGIATASGKGQSVLLGLPGSTTPIRIVLATQTGIESTYTVTVTRLLSSDNNLSALSVNAGSLAPDFSRDVLTYTVNVPITVTDVAVSATKSDPDAVMSGSVVAAPGQAKGQVNIPLGGPGTSTPVSITVAAPSGALKTYSITINRLFSTDSNLSALSVSEGSLDQAFAPNTVNYAVNVGILVGSVTITATKSDPNAVMLIGSVSIPAGTPTGQVTLSPGLGPNPAVEIRVTAQDGATIKIYTVTVTRSLI